MMNKIILFVFLTSSLLTRFAFADCRADAAVTNAEYMLQCNPDNATCKCPEQFVSLPVEFHMSVPLRGNDILRCEPPEKAFSAVKNAVQKINLAINQVVNKINSDNCENPAETTIATTNPRSSASEPTFDLSRYIEDQTYRFNDGCGYNLNIRASAVNDFIETALDEGPEKACMVSMCTTASYTVFLMALEELKSQGRLPAHVDLEELRSTKSIGWKYFNNMARPDLAVFELSIGSGRTINPSDINDCSTKDWPRGGDFVQLWRENGSGHSVVFSDYLKNESGEVIGICYWSSNQETRGLDHRCESISKMTKIIAARITL